MGSAEIIMLAKIVSDLLAIIYLTKSQAAGMTEEQKTAYWQSQKDLTDRLLSELINPPKV